MHTRAYEAVHVLLALQGASGRHTPTCVRAVWAGTMAPRLPLLPSTQCACTSVHTNPAEVRHCPAPTEAPTWYMEAVAFSNIAMQQPLTPCLLLSASQVLDA